MGLPEWLRGRSRDTQEERTEARPEAPEEAADDIASASRSPEEIEAAVDVRRDEEAIRHGGI